MPSSSLLASDPLPLATRPDTPVVAHKLFKQGKWHVFSVSGASTRLYRVLSVPDGEICLFNKLSLEMEPFASNLLDGKCGKGLRAYPDNRLQGNPGRALFGSNRGS